MERVLTTAHVCVCVCVYVCACVGVHTWGHEDRVCVCACEGVICLSGCAYNTPGCDELLVAKEKKLGADLLSFLDLCELNT